MIFLNFFEDGFVEVKESSGRFELFFFSWRKKMDVKECDYRIC